MWTFRFLALLSLEKGREKPETLEPSQYSLVCPDLEVNVGFLDGEVDKGVKKFRKRVNAKLDQMMNEEGLDGVCSLLEVFSAASAPLTTVFERMLHPDDSALGFSVSLRKTGEISVELAAEAIRSIVDSSVIVHRQEVGDQKKSTKEAVEAVKSLHFGALFSMSPSDPRSDHDGDEAVL